MEGRSPRDDGRRNQAVSIRVGDVLVGGADLGELAYAALPWSAAWCRTQVCMRERGRPGGRAASGCPPAGGARRRGRGRGRGGRRCRRGSRRRPGARRDEAPGRRRPRRRPGAGQRIRGRRAVRPESAKAEQLDVGDAEGGGGGPQLGLTQLADAPGRPGRPARPRRPRRGSRRRRPPGAAIRCVHQQRAAAERLVVGVGDGDEQDGRGRRVIQTERTEHSTR